VITEEIRKLEEDGRKGRRNRNARKKLIRQTQSTMLSGGWRNKRIYVGKYFVLILVVSSDFQCLELY
jgi:hypothetical protein